MIQKKARFQIKSKNLVVHLSLLFFAMIAIGPIFIILINSFKTTEGIFTGPIKLPNSETFTLDGFKRAVAQGNFVRNYANSTIITVGATLLTVICSCLAAYGITEYTTKLSKMIAGLFTIGIMLPVTLGTIVIIKMMVWLNILNTHISLILVYVGIFVPLGVILMVTNFRTVSNDLKEAARIDGANEFKTFLIVVPLVMPGVAAVAAITMLPVWNDLVRFSSAVKSFTGRSRSVKRFAKSRKLLGTAPPPAKVNWALASAPRLRLVRKLWSVSGTLITPSPSDQRPNWWL